MNEFRVIERDRCVIVIGALGVDAFRGVTAMCHKDAIVSPQLANMLGANFAFGLAEDIDALIASVKPNVDKAMLLRKPAGLSDNAARWLASGERGTSSNTMFTHLTGITATGHHGQSHPHDPSDLRRCLLLLDKCPELAPNLSTMASVSKEWAGLIRDWDVICSTFAEEVGDVLHPRKGAAAPRTYKLMKTAIGQ